MSDTISTSVSAAAIFSAEDGCARPPPNMNDIMSFVCMKSTRVQLSKREIVRTVVLYQKIRTSKACYLEAVAEKIRNYGRPKVVWICS